MLAIGSTPVLALSDTKGESVTLRPAPEGRGIFVYFMRALSCAQCNAAVTKMTKGKAAFDDAGIRVIVAVPEDRASAAAWKNKKAIPFDVAVGRTGTAHAEVGLLKKVFGLLQQSGSILLDGNGTVRYTHASTNPGSSYNHNEVAEAIAALPTSPASSSSREIH
jgi:peroxiredoxin